jgi:hypothetical protein
MQRSTIGKLTLLKKKIEKKLGYKIILQWL